MGKKLKIPKMREVKVVIRVRVPRSISDKKLVKLIDQMLDIGYADAQATLDTDMVPNDAKAAVKLAIGRVKVLEEPPASNNDASSMA